MGIIELLEKYNKDCDIKKYENLIEEATYINREIILINVDSECSLAIETLVRFWNRADLEIPIEKRDPIKIIIDSGGGDLTSAFTIVDVIKMSVTPVYTIVIGAAYSAGLLIAAAGHQRFCYPNASYMFHEGSVVNGSGSIDAGKFINFNDFYRNQLLKYKDLLMSSTKISEEWYKEHKNDDVWVFANEAIELGFVDKITTQFI